MVSAGLAIALVVLAGCHGADTSGDDSGDDTAELDPAALDARCHDASLNGDETAIDCGGSCGATCGIGEACGTGDDCLFGLCDEVCTAPTGGPTPTGEVRGSSSNAFRSPRNARTASTST